MAEPRECTPSETLDDTAPVQLCLCGCGRVIRAPAHLRGVKKFASDACRMRWHSARRQLALAHLHKHLDEVSSSNETIIPWEEDT